MKRIDWSRVTVLSITGAVWLLYVGILVLLPAQHHHRTPDLVTSEAWHQIAIRQQVRASVAEMYLRRCQDEPMTPIKCPSDRAKEGMWNGTAVDASNANLNVPIGRTVNFVNGVSVTAVQRITPFSLHLINRRSDDDGNCYLPVRGKGEAWTSKWNESAAIAGNAGDRADAFLLTDHISAIPASTRSTGPLPAQPIPCRLPIKIRTDGKLAESCEVSQPGSLTDGKETKWTTNQSTTAPAFTPTVSAITMSPLRAQSAAIVSSASTSSLHRPSAPPEAPVTCASDALGPVTTLWNKVSVDWYRASLAYPRDKQLPWLFQCRGDLAQLAATDASKDPAAAADLMAWLLTWLLDHGVISRESYAWHRFVVIRPQEAAGVTEVTVRFDAWESHGWIDRDGMNGEVFADPDCTECQVYFWAPMVPGTASVVKWGTR